MTIPPQEDQYDQLGRKILPRFIPPAPIQALPMNIPGPNVQAPVTPHPAFNQPLAPPPQTEAIPIRPQIPPMEPPGPAQAHLAEMQLPPVDHPSLGRQIYSRALGGLAKDPNVTEKLLHGPYDKAMTRFGQDLALTKEQAGVEERRQALPVQRATAQANANYKTEEETRKQQEDQVKHQEAVDKLNEEINTHKTARETAEKRAEIAEKRAKTAETNIDPMRKAMAMPPGPTRDAMIEEINKNYNAMHPHESEEQKVDTAGKIRARQDEEDLKSKPQQAAATTTATEKAKANAPVNSEDQSYLDAEVTRAKESPEMWNDIYKRIPAKLKSRFGAATADVKVPRNLSPTAATAVTNARTTILNADS